MVPSFPRMGLTFLSLLYFALKCYVEVGSLQYFNTMPTTLPAFYTPHEPRVLQKICLLKPDIGPCRGNIQMYYYDPKAKNCSTFEWGGCQGNGNRFDSWSKCLDTCLSKPETPKTAPRYCKLAFDYGYCFGAQKRWYYDHVWKVCKETLYSGCGGNKNNFLGYEKCDSICRLKKSPDQLFEKATRYVKKYLIINPINATSKRGLEQSTTKML